MNAVIDPAGISRNAMACYRMTGTPMSDLGRFVVELEGGEACRSGEQITTCPYNNSPWAKQHWLIGWYGALLRAPKQVPA